MKEFEWLEPTLDRVAALLRMPDRNNSYGTPKVHPAFAVMALRVMSRLWNLTVPTIIPNAKGGLDFTWHGIKTKCFLTDTHEKVEVRVMENDVEVFTTVTNPEDVLRVTLAKISQELTQVPRP